MVNVFHSWLTLFFMKKEDIKRYAPVGLISNSHNNNNT
ncbi:hypothetical protein SpAn4DRAFT_4122 [Sporomusa ovata]|uniref:Uncharacterized protein n=1 Tax=Sporomusa ovata TaxID=2378 RepID=A0A0U1L5I9_9FIRM|nr:hypothetical protein SpAn4DRAFT_4122 [Sporomusa ovata]